MVGYTSTFEHLHAVEACAKAHVDIMMEKPLAVSYHDALAMAEARAQQQNPRPGELRNHLVFEQRAGQRLVDKGELGEIRKVVVHDGHQGPHEIDVQPEFFDWLTDPKLNGAGALFDFGCYGADLMTWLMHGRSSRHRHRRHSTNQARNLSHMWTTKPPSYSTYPHAVAILEPSWNWPFAIKDMQVYGRTGEISTVLRDHAIVNAGQQASEQEAPKLDCPLRRFAALFRRRRSR